MLRFLITVLAAASSAHGAVLLRNAAKGLPLTVGLAATVLDGINPISNKIVKSKKAGRTQHGSSYTAATSSRGGGKRRKTGKAGGRKRKAGGRIIVYSCILVSL